MNLTDLLAKATREDLERLAHEHARADESMPRAQLLDTIAGVLRSHRFLHDYLFNRLPPTYAIITLLMDADGFSLPATSLRGAVTAETMRIRAALDSKTLLARDDQLRVYRRSLYQARSNDRQLDASESAILGVLRQELEIQPFEHFLLEHHADFREFWSQDEAFLREINALRSAGILFVSEGHFVIPTDLVKTIRRVLGVEMRGPSMRRLLVDHVNSAEMQEALAEVGLPTAGSRDERLERLMLHLVQPRVVLGELTADRLKRIAGDVGATTSGNREALIERIIRRIDGGHDIAVPAEPAAPPVEPRQLDEARFTRLFAVFRGHELADVLAEFDLKRWGTKAQQIQTLWGSHRAEATLLDALSSADLVVALERIHAKTQGTKVDRIQRLVEHFASMAALDPQQPYAEASD